MLQPSHYYVAGRDLGAATKGVAPPIRDRVRHLDQIIFMLQVIMFNVIKYKALFIIVVH